MKNLLYFYSGILFLTLIVSCKKHEDDLKGQEYLAGRMMYQDVFSGDNYHYPISNKDVYIAYHPSDNLNYMYSVTTDADGYFRFTNLKKSKEYDLFFTDSVNGLKYFVSEKRIPSNDTVYLLATPDVIAQNGISLVTKDPAGSGIQGVIGYAYDSYDIFKADSSNGTNTGAIHKFTTNEYGRDSWFNIANGTYYLTVSKESSGVLLLGYDSVRVENTGISLKEVTLATANSYARNGVIVNVKDIIGNPLKGASVYFYDNYNIYNSDSAQNSTQNAAHTLTTDASGLAKWLNIIPRDYYIIASKESSGTLLIGYDSVHVENSGNSLKEVTLATVNSYARNGVIVNVKDIIGNPLKGASVYFYDNYNIYNSDSAQNSTQNAAHTITTDANGSARWLNIPPRQYYITVVKNYNGYKLKADANVNIGGSEIKVLPVSLNPPTAVPRIEVTVLDNSNSPVSNAEVYLYTSKIIADLDSSNTAYTHKVECDKLGIAKKENIPAATYYLKGQKVVNSDTLKGTGLLNVASTGTSSTTIQIH